MSCSCAERASSLTRPLALLPLRFPSAHRQLTTLAVSLIPLFFLAHPRPSYCYRPTHVQSTSPSLLPCLPPRLRHGARGTGKAALLQGGHSLRLYYSPYYIRPSQQAYCLTSYSLLCLCPSCRRHPQLPPHRLPHFCPGSDSFQSRRWTSERYLSLVQQISWHMNLNASRDTTVLFISLLSLFVHYSCCARYCLYLIYTSQNAKTKCTVLAANERRANAGGPVGYLATPIIDLSTLKTAHRL